MNKLHHISVIVAAALVSASGVISCGTVPFDCEISAVRDTSFTGRGNVGELFTTVSIACKEEGKLQAVTLELNAPEKTVDALSIMLDGKEIARASVRAGKSSYKLNCNETVCDAAALAVCADISEDAAEGSLVNIDVKKLKISGSQVIVPAAADGVREVLLRRVCLFRPGDYGSKNYRIPALAVLTDGSLLAVNDKRKFNEVDLPEDIDIVARKSADGGKTWSEPILVIEGQGVNKGYGDPALAVADDGTIFCAFSGGYGLWGSTAENPQRNYICTSSDNGLTWSAPLDVTHLIWGKDVSDPVRKTSHSAFFASGNGIIIKNGEHKGRIMFVLAVADKNNALLNYAFWSDDMGATWEISDLAYYRGDEAKVIELNDGSILMSVRQNGKRGYNYSTDGGKTWGESGRWEDIVTNACDGDIIRYDDGLILHSLPNSMKRENVSIFCSFDEGRTWPKVKSLCSYNSIYSSLAVLPDGTIGAYIEENPTGPCELWYMNFSKDWLLK